MYFTILRIHNIFRWITAIVLVYALFRMYKGLIMKSAWTDADKKAGLFMTISLDTQLLLGFFLYLSFGHFGNNFWLEFWQSMVSLVTRFFAFPHIQYMLVAIIFGHIGYAIGKRTEDDRQKFIRVSIFYSLTFLTILFGMP